MASATQQTLQAFTHWLHEIVARGDWRAERDFIADTLTIHSDSKSVPASCSWAV